MMTGCQGGGLSIRSVLRFASATLGADRDADKSSSSTLSVEGATTNHVGSPEASSIAEVRRLLAQDGLHHAATHAHARRRCDDQEIRNSDVDHGRVWPDDGFLAKCLVQLKGDVVAAAQVAANFVRYREAAGWPSRIRAADVDGALRTGFHWLLWPPSPSALDCGNSSGSRKFDADDPESPSACLVFNMARLDTRICPVECYQKMSFFLMEHATDDPETQRRGIAVIVDFRDIRTKDLLSILTMDDIRRGLNLWKAAFPCRLRRIWILEPPAGLHLLIASTLALLKGKVRKRVRMASGSHGLSELAADLGPFIDLPQELGGVAGHRVDWETYIQARLLNSHVGCDGCARGQQDVLRRELANESRESVEPSVDGVVPDIGRRTRSDITFEEVLRERRCPVLNTTSPQLDQSLVEDAPTEPRRYFTHNSFFFDCCSCCRL